MNRLAKLAVLEVASNHDRWVRLVTRDGRSMCVLVPFPLNIDRLLPDIELFIADSPESAMESVQAIKIYPSQLDKVTSMELLDAFVFDYEAFRQANERYYVDGDFRLIAL